jgi:integrase
MKMAGLDRTVMLPNKLTMLPEYRPLYEVTTSHTARKTFIEAMFRETKSERITSAFTGHANGSRAFSRYTDVDDEMKREILNRLEHPKN